MKTQAKTLLAVLLLCLGFGMSNGQSLSPIPYENAGWHYTGWYYDFYWEPIGEDIYLCYFDGDTNINSNSYKKYYWDGFHEGAYPHTLGNHIYIGGMRNDGDLYYFLSRDSINEVLIYNLSKTNIGDSLPLGYYGHLEYLVIVDTSTQIMEDGSTRRVFELDNNWSPPNLNVESFYEGIGFDDGLIPHDLFTLYQCNGGYVLHTFCYYGEIIYYLNYPMHYIPNECGYTVGVVNNHSAKNDLSIYPNPFTTSTAIEYELTEPSHVQLTIYNAIGEVVYQAEDRMMPQGKHSFTWTADQLPESMYYAVMKSEEGVVVMKMVKQ